jgi:hypothetical protein
MNSYASLSELKSYFDFNDNTSSGLNVILRDYLIQASRGVDRFTRKKFFPTRRTLYFDHPPDGRTVEYPNMFLELIGLSGQAGDQPISLDAVMLRCGDNWNLTPYNTAEIRDNSGSLLNWSGTPRRSVVTDIIEGYRSDYEYTNEAWINSGTCLLDDMAASNTTLYTGSSAGYNDIGFSPRFKSEQIWRLGSGSDTEFVYVLDTGYGASPENFTHVIRGMNGTTARDHASGTLVQIWEPEYEIKINTMRLARWQYEVRNNPTGTRHFFPQMGGFELADSWPKDIRDALRRYRGIDVSSF